MQCAPPPLLVRVEGPDVQVQPIFHGLALRNLQKVQPRALPLGGRGADEALFLVIDPVVQNLTPEAGEGFRVLGVNGQ